MASVPGDDDQIQIQPASMLPCLTCGQPIIYSLNRHFNFAIGSTSTHVDFGGRAVPTLHRGIVGDLCHRCAIQAADESDISNLQLGLRELEVVRRRMHLPAAGTFQKFVGHPRPDDKALAGFSIDRFGVWIEPVGLLSRSVTIDVPGEGTSQILFPFAVVRCDGIHAEIHSEWNLLTNRQVDAIDAADQSTVRQLQRLMDGFRLLSAMRQPERIRSGGPRPIPVTYDAVRDLWQEMSETWDDRHGRMPDQTEFVVEFQERTGIKMSVRTLVRRLEEWGKPWPPIK
jgi:hypothetical protein